MITGKELFISRISHGLGRAAPPDTPTRLVYPHQMQRRYQAHAAKRELRDIFIANARAVGIDVRECSERDLAVALVEIVRKTGGPVVLADDPLLTGDVARCLVEAFTECHIWDAGAGREENMALAEKAKVGVARAEMALAESATTLLSCHGGNGRSITLLPENSVIVIRAETILPRLTQAMDWLHQQKTLPASVNFVSGPSSTADIELVRVQGVHGPLELVYIIVE